MHEFVIVRLEAKRLNTVKVVVDMNSGSNIDFELTGEVPPFNLPYLYIVKGVKCQIVSLITGQICKDIEYKQIAAKYIRKAVMFDMVKSVHFNDIFLHSQSLDQCLYLKLRAGLTNNEVANFSRFSKAFYDVWNSGGQLKDDVDEDEPEESDEEEQKVNPGDDAPFANEQMMHHVRNQME